MKAGDAVALAAEAKWGKEDSSPTSAQLDGLAASPVLTFTPERGLLRKQPASWRYEDTGRYAGKAAIELAQPGFTDTRTSTGPTGGPQPRRCRACS